MSAQSSRLTRSPAPPSSAPTLAAGPRARTVRSPAEMTSLLAVVDRLERAPTLSAAFPELAAAAARVTRVEAVALTTSPERDGALVDVLGGDAGLRAEALAIGAAAHRYFRGDAPIDLFSDRVDASSRTWVVLPLTSDGRDCLGVFAVALPARPRTWTVAFLACVARALAAALDRRRARAARAEAEASAADRAKLVAERDAILSTVSHDLRSPLGVILANAESLLGDVDVGPEPSEPPEGKRRIEAIQRNALRMTRLVADLVDFESIASGRVALEPQAVDPQAIVDAAIVDVAPLAASAGVRLVRGTRAPRPLVYADADRVVQVLMNLLGNAVKFTPRGGQISVGVDVVSGDRVRFAVRDSGVGIAPEELPHVFERHFRAPSSASRTAGSGLGLSICKSLVELSGGSIRAWSRLGRGTTMSVMLPALVTPPRDRRSRSAARRASARRR